VAEAEPIVALQPGVLVGGVYSVVGPISRGAMGEVVRARHVGSGSEVAIKRLLDLRNAARFEIEARLLSRLDHPRVVHVLGHFRDHGGHHLVMDLIRGRSLAELVVARGSPGLEADDAVEYARQACEALAYVHEQNVIHRDVKPSNLILGEQGIVLVDFGIARPVADGEETATVGIGTPGYMAPEILAGGVASPHSDVYSLAATLWALLAGRAPRYGVRGPPCEGLDVRLEATLCAGLELDPQRRIPSAEAFAAALGEKLAPAAGASLALTVPRPRAPGDLLEAIVRTAALVFESAAVSIAFPDPETGGLVFESAWGAGAREVVGLRLEPGVGIAGAVMASGEGAAVGEVRGDPRFAREVADETGYVPHTMLVVPLRARAQTLGLLSVLDRRDGRAYGREDLVRAEAYAELAVTTLDLQRRLAELETVTPEG
jgi:hypothetical protein